MEERSFSVWVCWIFEISLKKEFIVGDGKVVKGFLMILRYYLDLGRKGWIESLFG